MQMKCNKLLLEEQRKHAFLHLSCLHCMDTVKDLPPWLSTLAKSAWRKWIVFPYKEHCQTAQDLPLDPDTGPQVPVKCFHHSYEARSHLPQSLKSYFCCYSSLLVTGSANTDIAPSRTSKAEGYSKKHHSSQPPFFLRFVSFLEPVPANAVEENRLDHGYPEEEIPVSRKTRTKC